MTTPLVSKEQIEAIRKLDLIQEDALWEKQRVQREADRAQKARQRLVVLLGDLFKTFPDLDRVWLDFEGGGHGSWSMSIRACEDLERGRKLLYLPWERFKETATSEELNIRAVFGFVRAWGETMGSYHLSSKALAQLFPKTPVLTREEFADCAAYLLSGRQALDAVLRERIRLEKKGQQLDDQLPAPTSPRPGPRF